MSFFKGKFESLSTLVSDAVASGKDALIEAKDKSVEYSQKVSDGAGEIYSATKETLSDLAETTNNSVIVVTTKEKINVVSDGTRFIYESVSVNVSSAYVTSAGRVRSYADWSADKVSSYFNSTIEVDKSTDQIVAEIQGRLPVRPTDVDHIFQQTKQEALRRAISAFCLAPVMSGLDRDNELKYSNLSVIYKDFERQNNLHANENFANYYNERYKAQEDFKRLAGLPGAVEETRLVNGYDIAGGKTLDPYATDIEHVIPKKQFYEDLVLRLGTNDDQIIEAMNFNENLMFADRSLNRSKQDVDLVDYINKFGTRDPDDPDRITFTVGLSKKEVSISERDAMERYEKAQEELASLRKTAMQEIGMAVASAGARMAAQQVVGVIVAETVDIFVDEIKEITQTGLITDKKGVLEGLEERRANLYAKLSTRFEERKIFEQARNAGIEGGIAGVLSSIPQILISMLIKLPALVLSVIRECTLSTVRCVRIMLGNAEDKYGKISVVLFGAATAVIGLYVAGALSKALMGVPLLNLFNHSVADVLTGVLVTAVPLAAIYVFDQYKEKFSFRVVGGNKASNGAPGDGTDADDDGLDGAVPA